MTKNKKGFTIIEVVLVLAIAGLIFLMVFIALPALQRSQRNTRRRSDMARVLAQFTEYQSNNAGKMPSDSTEIQNFVDRYLVGQSGQNAFADSDCANEQFCDPDGTNYRFSSTAPLDTPSTALSGALDHNVYYYKDSKCGGTEGLPSDGSGDRDIAILYILEGGAIYCGDNQ